MGFPIEKLCKIKNFIIEMQWKLIYKWNVVKNIFIIKMHFKKRFYCRKALKINLLLKCVGKLFYDSNIF